MNEMQMVLLNKRQLMVLMLLTLASSAAIAASVGTADVTFTGLYDLVAGWATGYLGKTLAIAAFIVGGMVGFAKGTAMPALVGIVFAVVFGLGPSIIDTIMTATI